MLVSYIENYLISTCGEKIVAPSVSWQRPDDGENAIFLPQNEGA